jgi:phage-related tail fiber protein
MTAGTYRSVTVNNQGIVTAGTNPTTASGYGISDVYTKAEIDALLLALTNRIATLASYWVPKTIEQETFLSTTYKIDTQGYR